MVLPVFQHAYLTCSNVVCEYMYIQDGHYVKAQRLSMTIIVALKVKTSGGNSFLSHGQQERYSSSQNNLCQCFNTWIVWQ